jgi:hypothetical protein
METSDVSRFRQCILDGDWDSAEDILMRLGLSEEERLWVRCDIIFVYFCALDPAVGSEVPHQPAEIPRIPGGP